MWTYQHDSIIPKDLRSAAPGRTPTLIRAAMLNYVKDGMLAWNDGLLIARPLSCEAAA